jgi:outer membrane immunogenic protein
MVASATTEGDAMPFARHQVLLATATCLTIGLASGFASAADMPIYTKAPPIWNWTGFYAGGNIGYSWGQGDSSVSFFDSTPALLATVDQTIGMNGVIGGGQVGYNWQTGRWVLGLETDFQATGQQGTATFQCGAACGAPTSETVTDKLTWFGSVRGRVGYTVTPTMLLYGTGGLGYGDVVSNGSGTTSISSSEWKTGWVAGGGIETRISGNWTAKLEYLYYSDAPARIQLPLSANINSPGVTDSIVRGGVNYFFK